MDRYVDSANVQKNYELWEKIIRLVNEHQMPPADEPQPTAEEVTLFTEAIERELPRFRLYGGKASGSGDDPSA